MLISPAYAQMNKALHSSKASYGCSGASYAVEAKAAFDRYDCQSVLDYGCGKGTFKRAFERLTGAPIFEYDPAIEGKDGPPCSADLVVCTDVLEHIEPECLESVLQHMCSLANNAVFLQIATREAKKCLSDGRNAHLIVQGANWWFAKLASFIRVESSVVTPRDVMVIGVP